MAADRKGSGVRGREWVIGCRVLGYRVQGTGYRVQGSGYRVHRVQGIGYRV